MCVRGAARALWQRQSRRRRGRRRAWSPAASRDRGGRAAANASARAGGRRRLRPSCGESGRVSPRVGIHV
eukprot:2600649-Prymnesium_polylepis.1